MNTPLPPVPLPQARERAVRILGEHFARDVLDERELQERLDRVHAATSLMQLQQVLADLPALAPEPHATAAVPAGQVRDRQTVLAVMSGVSRKGSWVPPRAMQVVAVMGGAELDFREARFGSEAVEIEVFALMGGVEITVPPGVRVEVSGFALMGGFGECGTGAPAEPGAPVVRVSGFAMMGGVEVRTRPVGAVVKRREWWEPKD